MNTKSLGWTELNFTQVGLGTWAIGGGGWAFGWGPQDDNLSVETIHRALDLGINWIDTAPAYGLGHCETVVGQALKGRSTKPLIATKCGRSWGSDRKLFPALRKKIILAEVDVSLTRLGVEVIDLYQVHWPQPEEEIEEAWDAIADVVRSGKIRYAGVCNFNVSQIKRIQPIHPVASVQPPYSMLMRDVEAELLPFCAEENIGVVAYSPMQKGLLTGKITRERIAEFAKDDHRSRDPQFLEPLLDLNLELVDDTLRPIAERNQMTVAQLAIAWVLRRPEMTAAIVGARRPGQIEETVQHSPLALSEDDLHAIDHALRIRQESIEAR